VRLTPLTRTARRGRAPARTRQRGLLIGGLAVVVAGVAVSGARPPLAARAEPAPPVGSVTAESTAGTPRPAAQHAVTDLTLATGDRVRLSRLPGGQQSATVLPPDKGRPSSSVQFLRFSIGGDLYVVPGSAVRALGGTLDMGLFDVSYLARAGLADGQATSLPLVATLDGTAAAAVPGLAVTGSGTGDRPARLDKARSWQLGRALARGGATLPGLRHLSLAPARAGVATPPTARGNTLGAGGGGIPRRTLRVHLLDRTGTPALGVLFVQNVDDTGRYLGVSLVQGDTSLSLPEGHYMVAATVLRFHDDGVNLDSAFVANPELAVTTPNSAVTLDARTAQPLSASVPGQQLTPGLMSISFDRADAHGNDLFFGTQVAWAYGGLGNADSPLFATPTRPVSRGSFGFEAYFISSPGPAFDPQGTHYLLDFADDHRVPASLAFSAAPGALTRADERYHWPDVPQADCEYGQGVTVSQPWSAYGGGYFVPLPGATARTDYLFGPSSATWYQLVQTPACEFFLDRWRHLRPGPMTDEWFKGPMGPAIQREDIPLEHAPGLANVPAPPLSFHTYGCPACRQDDNADLRILPWGDSVPGHFVVQEFDQQNIVGTTRLYRDGVLAMTGILPFAVYPMLPEPATYRLESSLTKTAPSWPLSTRVDTSWTFRSDPNRPGQRPPAFEDCLPDPSVGCALLPLLFLNYDLPLALNETAPAGAAIPVAVRVSRQEHMNAARGLTATLQVSYDDGATWQPAAPLRAGGQGTFSGTITHPALAATNGYVALRVHAADADGNAVDQTILRAYRLADR
jgi:hypothetical protein